LLGAAARTGCGALVEAHATESLQLRPGARIAALIGPRVAW
jgi:hypothetical protein